MIHPPLILVGPTGSGKSDLALRLAKTFNADIINADAVQLYQDLSILSARPDKTLNVTHHLYGVLPSHESSTAYQWASKAFETLRQIDKRVILVGGSGLYIKALIEGLSPIPGIDKDLRTKVRCLSPQDLAEKLKYADPLAFNIIHPNHTSRLARALEVFLQTGTSIVTWNTQRQKPLLTHYRYFILDLPKETLELRIDQRVLKMMEKGALDEVKSLGENPGYLQKAIGVLELQQVLLGKLSLPEAIFLIQTKTKQYAKRQRTWFRTQSPSTAQAIRNEEDLGCFNEI